MHLGLIPRQRCKHDKCVMQCEYPIYARMQTFPIGLRHNANNTIYITTIISNLLNILNRLLSPFSSVESLTLKLLNFLNILNHSLLLFNSVVSLTLKFHEHPEHPEHSNLLDMNVFSLQTHVFAPVFNHSNKQLMHYNAFQYL